jgi:hypothetical protein
MVASKLISELRLSYSTKSNVVLRMETISQEIEFSIIDRDDKGIKEIINMNIDRATLLRLKSIINTHLINTKR